MLKEQPKKGNLHNIIFTMATTNLIQKELVHARDTNTIQSSSHPNGEYHIASYMNTVLLQIYIVHIFGVKLTRRQTPRKIENYFSFLAGLVKVLWCHHIYITTTSTKSSTHSVCMIHIYSLKIEQQASQRCNVFIFLSLLLFIFFIQEDILQGIFVFFFIILDCILV